MAMVLQLRFETMCYWRCSWKEVLQIVMREPIGALEYQRGHTDIVARRKRQQVEIEECLLAADAYLSKEMLLELIERFEY